MEKRGLTGMGIWNTTDYKGQPVTWYSAEEIEKYKQALDEIENLIKSINDEFENDDIEQQLHYSQDVGKQILQIIKAVKDE